MNKYNDFDGIEGDEVINKDELEKLKELHFSEKDKFILSDKNTFETTDKKVTTKISSRDYKLPARYLYVDKV